jgi:3-oxoacyl-[acyl-carrier protein] reductase
MDLHLRDRTILIAGSTRGIGRAIAVTLLEEGARVCITGRDRDALAAAERELSAKGRVLALDGDLSQAEQISKCYAAIAAKWGALDGLIANLGTGSGKAGWDQPEEEWERLFRLNFQASVRLAQGAIPLMLDGGGSIVFISSITGVEATPAPLPYSAAKGALINYSKNLSRQVAARNIRVNCVAPGNILFAGGSWERQMETHGEAVMQSIRTEVPMARFGKPEEIASVAAFLCSDRAAFITGSTLVADGGQTRSF